MYRSRADRWNMRGEYSLMMLGRSGVTRAVVISVLAAAVWARTSSGSWVMVDDPSELAGRAHCVVFGRMVRVHCEPVRFRGGWYAKHTGFILTRHVILKPEGVTLPRVLQVQWGNRLGDLKPVFLSDGRFISGTWFLHGPSIDGLTLAAQLEPDFFMAGYEWRRTAIAKGKVAPVWISLIRRAGGLFLRARYMNLSYEPCKVPMWSLENGRLFLPPSYELVVYANRQQEKDDWPGEVLGRSESLPQGQERQIALEPCSYAERELDLCSWSALDGGREGKVGWAWLNVGGRRHAHALVWDPTEYVISEQEEPPLFLPGDCGTPVWWMPSTRKLLWVLGCAGPLLVVGGFALRKRVRVLAYACAGVVLGLLWTLVLIDNDVLFTCRAAMAVLSVGLDQHFGNWVVFCAVLLAIGVYSGLPAAMCSQAAKGLGSRKDIGPALLCLWWLAIPVALGSVYFAFLGWNAFM